MARRLWIYKNNAVGHPYQIGVGDWFDFIMQGGGEWGGSHTIASPESLRILRVEMKIGDEVLAIQTDRRVCVALLRVSGLPYRQFSGEMHRVMKFEILEVFSPPVRIYELKKMDPALAAVAALQPGVMSALRGTTAAEARILRRACGLTGSHSTAFSLRSSPQVERAAIDVVKKHYRGWSCTDRQHQRNIGYDLEFSRGSEHRHVEVKGLAGGSPSILLTSREVQAAEQDPDWELAVVVGALTKPRLMLWSADDFIQNFVLRPTQYFAVLR